MTRKVLGFKPYLASSTIVINRVATSYDLHKKHTKAINIASLIQKTGVCVLWCHISAFCNPNSLAHAPTVIS